MTARLVFLTVRLINQLAINRESVFTYVFVCFFVFKSSDIGAGGNVAVRRLVCCRALRCQSGSEARL